MSRNHVEDGPELVVGLVAPLGVLLDRVEKELTKALSRVKYRVELIRLSILLHDLQGKEWQELRATTNEGERITRHIMMGNRLCQRTSRGDALALLSVGRVRSLRQVSGDANRPRPRVAYLLRSIKRVSEVDTLRRIYGDRFILVASTQPEMTRQQNLAELMARSARDRDTKQFMGKARDLMNVDEAQTSEPFGQYVSQVYPLADVFLDPSVPSDLRDQCQRFVELLFQNNLITPTREEYGMFHAQAAAYRSASLSRQVGAAVTDEVGSVIAVGCNEVPAAFGGQYWPGGKVDGRDHTRERDPSAELMESLLADVIDRLSPWFMKRFRERHVDDLLQEAIEMMQGGYLLDLIEYMRAVHAEMAAITDAARRGTPLQGRTLYCTTMPCHECAKHIVASGVSTVVFIEPYVKSLVRQLYSDSVELNGTHDHGSVAFRQFVGVAPRRYPALFRIERDLRRTKEGRVIDWRDLDPKSPRVDRSVSTQRASLVQEQDHYGEFNELLVKLRLISPN